MRRRLEPIEPSLSRRKAPAWDPWVTWVPPHSSREKSPMSTMRTVSPYFSPNRAMAAGGLGFGAVGVPGADGGVVEDVAVDGGFDPGGLVGGDGGEVGEVEAQAVGLDE